MKAIHIDAENREIKEIEVKDYKDMQKAVGGLITMAHDPNDKNTIYVDDEGLLKGYDYFFSYEGAHQEFAGNGIIVGINYDTGESTDCSLSIDEVKNRVEFLTGLEMTLRYKG